MLPKEIILITLIPVTWSCYQYIKAAKSGKVNPNLVSWGMWAIFAITGGVSSIFAGQTVFEVFTTFTAGLTLLAICLATIFFRKGFIKFSKLDYTCLVLSLLGFIFWLTSGNPVFGLGFSILADLIAGLPTIVKAYQKPEQESYLPFMISFFAQSTLLLTLKNFNVFTLTFPVYLMLCSVVICLPLFKYKFSK
jgi:hypothetical protein